MQPHPASSPLRSSRLENVRLEPGQATLDLDGKPVTIGAESAAPSLTALRSFCDSARADLRSRPGMEDRPGWFGRLRTWIGGLFGRGRPEIGEGRPSPPDRAVGGEPPHRPARRPAASEPGPQAEPSGRRPTRDPRLQSVFADKEGVHLTWQTSAPNEPHTDAAFTCRLDSEVADKLQDCFGQLGKLGYKVTGLELLRAAPEKAAQAEAPVAPIVPVAPVVEGASHPRKAPHKEEKGLTLEISTGPVPEGGKDRPVLAAPEKLLAALRGGTDAALPAEERLTSLRGTLGKGGLKITEVGFGGGKEQQPVRWEGAGQWLARQARPQPTPQKELVAET